jgi:S-layer protein (TIGR01567 family)
MRIAALTTIVPMVILLSIAMASGAGDNVKICGQVATGNFEWNAQNFAGFYYDIDDNLGTEKITTTITDGKLLEPTGIVYNTTTQKKDFDFADWGFYNVIGFLGDRYFAGYINDPNVNDANEILFKKSTDENSLSHEQLETILTDDNAQMTVTTSAPLTLEEGYELAIKFIDAEKVYLELSKDGSIVDSKAISPSKNGATMADKTYYYNKTVGACKDLVIIAVHFENAFRMANQGMTTVDGVWQISEVATEVKVDAQYDKMRIASVTADTIAMDNKDYTINLSINQDNTLMGDIKIKTIDWNTTEADPLRYYICKEATIDETLPEIEGSTIEAWGAFDELGPYPGYLVEDPIPLGGDNSPSIRAHRLDRDGCGLYGDGHYDDALAKFIEAIHIFPDQCDLWYKKGLCLSELKRYDDAIKSYNEAIRLKPNYSDAKKAKEITLKRMTQRANA